MQAFQSLLYEKKIDVDYLTTHTFKLEEAPQAYDLILEKAEPYIGIIIEYDKDQSIAQNNRIALLDSQEKVAPAAASIGFIGAGSYAQGSLLPNIPKKKTVALKGVLTASGVTARSVAERFGFEFCTSNENDLLNNGDINTVFIATRHDSHAKFVSKALRNGKNVFVEKPLCLTESELNEIVEVLLSYDERSDLSDKQNDNDKTAKRPLLMVGFNRRFAPLTKKLKAVFPQGPLAMTYRINAGSIPADSWIQDWEVGGGRIIGEVCHFVDMLTCLNGSLPASVYAIAMKDSENLGDVMNVSLTYRNGSIGTISYLANGDKGLSKERIEVFGFGTTAILDDFKTLQIYSGGKMRQNRRINQDKGQKNQVKAFVNAIIDGTVSPIAPSEIYSSTFATFRIIESIRCGECVKM